jgi:hypothetical protein
MVAIYRSDAVHHLGRPDRLGAISAIVNVWNSAEALPTMTIGMMGVGP